MINKINYTLVGLFFVIVVSAIGIAAWWLNGSGNGAEFRPYYIQTGELPSGIKKDGLVKFIGVDAGRIGDIKFSNEKEAIIEIELLVKKDLPIKTDSVAKAEFQGITGLGYLNISKGSASAKVFSPSEKAMIKLEASALSAIGNKANDISVKIDRALENVNKILNDENINGISKIIKNAEEIAARLNSENVDLAPVLRNVNEAAIDFKKLINSSNAAIENINSLAKNADKSMILFTRVEETIEEKIKNGEYDFKDSLKSISQESVKTASEMRKTLKELRNTLFRLQDDPYEFFFKDPKDEK